MSPLQLSNNTHAVAKVLDEKYETMGEGSSKKENVIIMTPEEITEIKQHAEAIAAILYGQIDAEQVNILPGIEKTVRHRANFRF